MFPNKQLIYILGAIAAIGIVLPVSIVVFDQYSQVTVDDQWLILTCSTPGYDWTSRIYLMHEDGSDLHTLLPRRFNRVYDAVWSSDGEWIAFVNFDHTGQLQAIRPDGTGLHDITVKTQEIDVWATNTMSLNGEWIYFTSWQGAFGDPHTDIYRAHFDGTDLQQLEDTDYTLDSWEWSPGDSWIAMISDSRALRLIRPDGSEAHMLADMGSFRNVTALTWSHNGDWIAFESSIYNDDGSHNRDVVHAIRPDGDDVETIFSHPGYRINRSTRWSPNGDWLYFSATDKRTNIAKLFRVHVDHREAESLFDAQEAYISSPVWSPNGEWLYFTVTGWDFRHADLLRMRPDGSDRETVMILVDDRFAKLSTPVWSPNGGWIYLSARKGGFLGSSSSIIYRARPDGSDLQRLATIANCDAGAPDWLPLSDRK